MVTNSRGNKESGCVPACGMKGRCGEKERSPEREIKGRYTLAQPQCNLQVFFPFLRYLL